MLIKDGEGFDPSAPVQILLGDCRERLKELPSNSIHCVVTSPPYWGLRDYGVDGQIGLERSVDEFLAVMVDVFRQVRRVLRDDGTCWMNLGDTYCNGGAPKKHGGMGHVSGGQKKLQEMKGMVYHPHRLDTGNIKPKDLIGIPWRTALALQNDGWYLRSDIIWHKPNPVPEPDRGRPTVAHEYLFLLTKSPKYYYDTDAIREVKGDEPTPEDYAAGLGSNLGADSLRWSAGYKKISHNLIHPGGRNKRTVWTISTEGFPGAHFATFPQKLVEPCILAGTSAKGACGECGAPYRRVTEPSPEYQERLGAGWHDHQGDLEKGQRGTPAAFNGLTRITIGWSGCGCNAPVVPCRVLDPFNGAGTTGVVARRLMRHYVGIELNPEYAEMAEQRLLGDMPLFNS